MDMSADMVAKLAKITGNIFVFTMFPYNMPKLGKAVAIRSPGGGVTSIGR